MSNSELSQQQIDQISRMGIKKLIENYSKSQGKDKGKPKKQIDQQLWDELYAKWKDGEITAVEFMKRVG